MINKETLITAESGEIVRLKLHQSAFFCFQHKSLNSASFFINLNTSSSIIKELITAAQKYLQVPECDINFKIISPKLEGKKILKFINSTFNFKFCKTQWTENEYELILNPSSGKIKLSIEPNVFKAITRVIVVDDSLPIRKLLRKMIELDPNLKVVAEAKDPSNLKQLIKEFKPDVMTLDIHMPFMNGVDFLKTLEDELKIPTIMISSIRLEDGPLILEALDNGAVDYITKPNVENFTQVAPEIIKMIKSASLVNIAKLNRNLSFKKNIEIDEKLNNNNLIVIGASTGGTTAIYEILTKFPDEIPPILITQHIPAVFSKAFADRINRACAFNVKEAEDKDIILPSNVYIAPGGKQMKVERENRHLVIRITDDSPVNDFRPSVDYLFNSVSENIDRNVIGILLTGMGRDGAQGLLNLKNKGVETIAQDEASSIVFGMPKRAIELGAVNHVVDLHSITSKIYQLMKTNIINKKVV